MYVRDVKVNVRDVKDHKELNAPYRDVKDIRDVKDVRVYRDIKSLTYLKGTLTY